MSVGNSRYLTIGPGGRNCPCCFPKKGTKDRRSQFRIAKRKAERAAMREAENDIIDEHQMILDQIREDNWYDDEDLYCEKETYDYQYEEAYDRFDDYWFCEEPYESHEDDYSSNYRTGFHNGPRKEDHSEMHLYVDVRKSLGDILDRILDRKKELSL